MYRILLALALALLVIPTAATAQPGGRQQVPWGSGLCEQIVQYRDDHNVSPERNVAVFEFEYPDTKRRGTIAIDSDRFKGGHAERRLSKLLRGYGFGLEQITGICSELDLCYLPFAYCRNLVKDYPRLERVNFNFEYGDTPESRARGKDALRGQVNSHYQARDSARSVMRTPGMPRTGGPAPDALARPFRGGPGGVDFSSLELRYVGDTGSGKKGIPYSFKGVPGPADSDPAAGLAAARQASDAFFTWLTLPSQTHWVNLNPNEPDRIIDAQFGRTEAGRILLEADLAMKKSLARAMHPDHPAGAAFWPEFDALFGNRPDADYCFSFRQEIVPAPATVSESATEMHILEAPLRIEAVSQYYPGYSCGPNDPAMEARKQELYRRFIVPVVEQEINTSAAYAPLRRVYYSRVAAEWFKRRAAAGQRTAFNDLIDRGRLDPWALNPPWNPRPVFDEMVRSLTQGEFRVERPKETGGVTWTRVYSFGGVNFSRAESRGVSSQEFKAKWPRRAGQVRQSMRQAAVDGGEVWLGAGDRAGGSDGAPVRVSLSMRASHSRARAGQRLTFGLRVTNPGRSAVRDVRVCARMPAGLRYLGASRRARLRDGEHCWGIARLAGRRSASIRVTARVAKGARGRLHVRATAAAQGSAGPVEAGRTVRIGRSRPDRPGGVTG